MNAQPASVPFPKKIRYTHKRRLFGHHLGWTLLLAAMGVFLAGLFVWWGILSVSGRHALAAQPPPFPASGGFFSPTAALSPISGTPVPPTVTPAPPSPTPAPSSTAASFPVQVHALDVPVEVDGQQFLIHRVLDGEQLLLLARNYDTSVDVIKTLNNQLPEPIWTGSVVVLAPGLLVVDPGLPAFTAYEVLEDNSNFETVAEALGVDLSLLKYYNRCSGSCSLAAGDWILVPYPR